MKDNSEMKDTTATTTHSDIVMKKTDSKTFQSANLLIAVEVGRALLNVKMERFEC